RAGRRQATQISVNLLTNSEDAPPASFSGTIMFTNARQRGMTELALRKAGRPDRRFVVRKTKVIQNLSTQILCQLPEIL
ncbi:MAG TPA: hypothetical protein PKH31_08840, partial [Candidatus Sumerlaeota bacterium]|nr:hypothetical protein [Candidatus Sumerlaeota bacterium]